MKKQKHTGLFLLITISAWGLVAYALWQLNFLKPSFFKCCQYIFLDRASDIGRWIPPMADVYLLALIILSVLSIGAGQFGMTRKYRSMLLLRYQKKTAYIRQTLKKAFSNAVLVTGIIGSILLLSYTLITGRCVFTGSAEEMTLFLYLLLNLCLFFNLMAAVSFFITLAANDLIALMSIIGFSCFMLIADGAIHSISLLTGGSMVQLFWGSSILTIGLMAVYGLIFYYVRHYDML